MLELYKKYWLPFGELLTDMEREGVKIDMEHIKKIKDMAVKDSEHKKTTFMEFIKTVVNDPNWDLFNLSSGRQMQQLLHAPMTIKKKEPNENDDDEPEEFEDNEDDDLNETRTVNRKVIM
jgi:DNA polymerase-1